MALPSSVAECVNIAAVLDLAAAAAATLTTSLIMIMKMQAKTVLLIIH